MTQDDSDRTPFADSAGEQGIEYRRFSGLAIAAALLTVVSLVAFATWMLWWVPLLASFLAALSLYSLRDQPALRGRRLATIALTVALIIAAAAPTRFVTRGRRIAAQAEQAGIEWLELLSEIRLPKLNEADDQEEDRPDKFKLAKAHQLGLPTARRNRFDTTLVNHYLDDERRKAELEAFANERLIHTLFTLGSARVTIDHFATESSHQDGEIDRVISVFVITFLRDGRPESFFVQLTLERERDDSERGKWRIARFREYLPPGVSAS